MYSLAHQTFCLKVYHFFARSSCKMGDLQSCAEKIRCKKSALVWVSSPSLLHLVFIDKVSDYQLSVPSSRTRSKNKNRCTFIMSALLRWLSFCSLILQSKLGFYVKKLPGAVLTLNVNVCHLEGEEKTLKGLIEKTVFLLWCLYTKLVPAASLSRKMGGKTTSVALFSKFSKCNDYTSHLS